MTIRAAIRRIALAATVLGVATLATAPDVDPTVEAAPASQRVLLVSDSVGLGTRGVLQHAFPADWEVNVIGTPAYFVEKLESSHVKPTIAAAPWMVGDHVVVAGGYNYPFWDPDRFDRSIDSMVATLTAAGVDHVYWVTLREVKPQYISASAWRQVQPYYWYFPTVNDHLEKALDRHPNLSLVDWAAAADRPGITYDAIHLNREGAELYSSLIAGAVHTNETRPIDGSITRVDVTDDPDVAAVALNLAAAQTRRRGGFFTAFACDDDLPNVANLTYDRADTVSGAAIVPVDADGNVCIYNNVASQIVVDLFGTFDAEAGIAEIPPNRAFDSRASGTPERAGATRSMRVSAPGAPAVALTVTAIKPSAAGYITTHPCHVVPTTATVNFLAGDIVPNLVFVEPDADGNVCITVTGATSHLTVDRFATFTNADAIHTIVPTRVVDTRADPGEPTPGQVVRFSLHDAALATEILDPAGANAVFLNLAVVRAAGSGYGTVWPCDEPTPGTANINFRAGDTISNFVTVAPDGDGDVCITTTAATDVVIDVLGTASAGFDGFTPLRRLDTRG